MKKAAKKTQTLAPTIKVDVKADVKHPQQYPWPYKDNSVMEMTCSNVFEFVPGKDRGRFMDEVYRVLAPEGKALFSTRYWSTGGAVQDYRYEWPPLVEASFLYFNKGWREANQLDLGLKCDFDFTYGYNVESNTASRSDETRSFNIKHYTNVVDVLQVMLTKRKEE
jgi:Methyltransferase domain